MSLESVTYVGDLTATNPTSSDAKSQGDDHIRNIKSALRESFGGFAGAILVSGTDGGAADAYTLTPTTALVAYGTKMVVEFTPNATNTGASTLNISALGAKNIYTAAGVALSAGDLVSGYYYLAVYDGTQFRLLSTTKNYVDQLAFSSALPSQTGNSGKFVTTNGTTASWAAVAQTVVRSARTSDTILAEADRGTLIDITSGTFSQTFTAAATLGSGWYCYIRNTGTGVVTLDPNGSETIDGVASGELRGTLLIQCDGTNFNAIKIGDANTTQLLTSGTSWTAPIGVRKVRIRGVGGGGSGGKSANTTAAGSGSGGGYFEAVVSTSPGTAYTYAIGAAGASQTSNAAGNNGGNTTWNDGTTTYTGSGGVGGKILGTSGPSAGGTGTNGTVNISGGSGQVVDASTIATLGGGTPLGLGGVGTLGAVNGVAPTGYGSGSGGASSSHNSLAAMQGCIILEY